MDIVTLGELLIDMFPAETGVRLAEVTAFHPKPGGAPANVAVAAKRLGRETAFIGKVGDDLFGEFLRKTLADEGVDVRGVRVSSEARTTLAIIAKPDENTAEFVFYRNPGADQRLRVNELDRDLLKSAKAFHFGSLSLTDEPAAGATLAAIEIVREAGGIVSYDVNYRPSLWSAPRVALAMARAVLPLVDVLKVNETELALLAGVEMVDPLDLDGLESATRTLLDDGPRLIICTFGKDGSYYQTADTGGFVPPFVVETVDAVGSGDSFISGLLTRLTAADSFQEALDPLALREAVRFANACGALTATRQGVIPALPTLAEVEAFLNKQ